VQETADLPKVKGMSLLSVQEYHRFVTNHRHVKIENIDVEIGNAWQIKEFGPSKEYKPEEFTVWSFPSRGDWATHSGNYRGNWSPYIPRNIITKYSRPGELVLDEMCGSGTTLIECKLLGRNGVGVDINPDAVMVTLDRLNFDYNTLDKPGQAEIKTYVGDARNLDLIQDESIDLVATHPPYAGIIAYSGKRLTDDLSRLRFPAYIDAMRRVAAEAYRVLKQNRYCGLLIGDTRKGRHYIPISLGVLQAFLSVGFILKEDIIKIQHKTMTTRQKWRGHSYDFYKIAHEHLYVFRKPAHDEKTARLKYSKKWW